MKLIAITALFGILGIGCAGGKTEDNGKAGSDDANAKAASSEDSLGVVPLLSGLPKCSTDLQGKAYYVMADKQFFVCQKGSWVGVNLKGADGLAGKDGAAGKDGSDGKNGDDGATGKDGLNTLGRRFVLASGSAECPAGGHRYEMGLDANRNLILEDAEVDPNLTSVICNGKDAAESYAYDAKNQKIGKLKFEKWVQSYGNPELRYGVELQVHGELAQIAFKATSAAVVQPDCYSYSTVSGPAVFANVGECTMYYESYNCADSAYSLGVTNSENRHLMTRFTTVSGPVVYKVAKLAVEPSRQSRTVLSKIDTNGTCQAVPYEFRARHHYYENYDVLTRSLPSIPRYSTVFQCSGTHVGYTEFRYRIVNYPIGPDVHVVASDACTSDRLGQYFRTSYDDYGPKILKDANLIEIQPDLNQVFDGPITIKKE